ncbi:MAG: hypothetical protein RBS84_09870 [Kiritimatiellia bacterium]|jgi:hypothetical protein|nr:hypothetical protein [Kiritimatiellia bacterium]
MRYEVEQPFGSQLHQLVSHLIKNDVRIPRAVHQAALAFENESWGDLDDDTKRDRVRQIAADTEAPSDVNRHFESYPHPYSKKQYAKYLGTLRTYKLSLGL